MTTKENIILVTGASGFVGQHLVRLLSAKGHTVRALYNSHLPTNSLQQLPGLSWHKHDLLDIFEVEEAMAGVTDVYHCAAIVSFHPKDKAGMLHFNVESTANIVNQALEQGIRKMMFVSSIASLGRTQHNAPITEEEQWEENKYNSVYSLSKHNAELEVWRGMAEGLNAVVVNPGIILGEGNWDEGSARLMKVVDSEFPFYTQGINGWVDVQDVVNAMYLLMQSDITEERFILSAGNFGYHEVFSMMAQALGKKPPHIKASPFMTGLVWRFSMLKHKLAGGGLTITRETARTSQSINNYDNSKLLKFLPGFSYTPMQQTIARMAAAYQRDANM